MCHSIRRTLGLIVVSAHALGLTACGETDLVNTQVDVEMELALPPFEGNRVRLLIMEGAPEPNINAVPNFEAGIYTATAAIYFNTEVNVLVEETDFTMNPELFSPVDIGFKVNGQTICGVKEVVIPITRTSEGPIKVARFSYNLIGGGTYGPIPKLITGCPE